MVPALPTGNKLAVFDIDGTLTDSVPVHQAAFVQALHLMGCSNYSTDWPAYPHHTDSAIFRQIFESHAGRTTQSGDIALFEQHLTDAVASRSEKFPVRPIRDAGLFLSRLGAEFDIVFATGSLKKPALLKLRQAGISLPVELVVASNTCDSREEIFSEAIATAKKEYGRKQYDRIVCFGDGLWDYRTATALGLEFIGIGNQHLKEQGAANVFLHYDDETLYALLELEAARQTVTNAF